MRAPCLVAYLPWWASQVLRGAQSQSFELHRSEIGNYLVKTLAAHCAAARLACRHLKPVAVVAGVSRALRKRYFCSEGRAKAYQVLRMCFQEGLHLADPACAK